jgi:biopolymer transport protein ExbB/TolQ
MDNILMSLFALLAVVSIVFIIWVTQTLIDVAKERDEWRERAVRVNAILQEIDELRPFRSNTRVSPNSNDSALQTLSKGE